MPGSVVLSQVSLLGIGSESARSVRSGHLIQSDLIGSLAAEAQDAEVVRVARPPSGDRDVGQDVHRVTQRCHLELDGNHPQLLDRAGAADVAPADERDRLAPPLTWGRGKSRFITHIKSEPLVELDLAG